MTDWKETKAWLIANGFAARDEALWTEALTHGSLGEGRDYQRLEFLGDRVLGLAIAEWLFENQNSASEGTLARVPAPRSRAASACPTTCGWAGRRARMAGRKAVISSAM